MGSRNMLFDLHHKLYKMDSLKIIIQARTGSTRLPAKMILPFFEGKGILELLLLRIKKAGLAESVIVATTTDSRDDVICDIAKKIGIKSYRGDENDVLDRFIQTGKNYQATKIIRVCADNPFLDMLALKNLITIGSESSMDYISYCTSNNLPTIKTHYGFWAEYVTLEALEKVSTRTDDKLYHEHVTNYIYTHPEQFKIQLIPISTLLENRKIRLTIDTLTDFQMQQTIYKAVYNKNPDFKITDIVDYLDLHPNLYSVMNEMIIANQK